MKKEFEIIETNSAMYQEFYNIKANNKLSMSTMCLTSLVGATLFLGGIGLSLMFFDSTILILTCGVGLYVELALTMKLCEMLEEKKKNNKLKKFQEKYPDFDIDIDVNEVKEKLKEYRIKNIPIYSLASSHEVTEEEKHLSFYKDRFKEMTNEEKIAFLENEKEFWSQCKENNKEAVKGIQKKKDF